MNGKKAISITDAELPIMKVLWDRGGSTTSDILDRLSGNSSTIKTLLLRVVKKGAVRAESIDRRTNRYFPVVTKEEYIEQTRRNFLHKAFDDSREQFLVNFVQGENVTKEELERLIQLVERE